ncbi:hypothetical protein, partial [Francisella tularensis]|uniref:hypothetical protein n=1 Tax=Francisella tularensis TaxID=263 RepID=UPI001A7EC37A
IVNPPSNQDNKQSINLTIYIIIINYKYAIIKICRRKVYRVVCNCYDENTAKKGSQKKWLLNSKFKVSAKV